MGGGAWTNGPTTQFNPTRFNADYQPTSLWGAVRRPYPTGAWWTNLVLGKGDNNVAQLPYAIKATDAEGVQVCMCLYTYIYMCVYVCVCACVWK